MTHPLVILAVATVLLALGLALALPRGRASGRALGAVLLAVSLGLFAAPMRGTGDELGDGLFYVLAGITVVAALATITSRNPVYSAIWFGLSLLGTAGLFLYDGAQFLGVATIVVYAGAILVTFLFVLMLAQPKGNAFYDRLSWGAPLSAATAAVVVGVLSFMLANVFQNPQIAPPKPPFATAELKQDILADEHMANLGARLFSSQLVAIEVAGTLLLVALVGTVAIVAQIKRPGEPGGHLDG